jgi:hypothetical protein
MIYGSFAMMSCPWFAGLILYWIRLEPVAVNMAMKEASMSRYPRWAAYQQEGLVADPAFSLTRSVSRPLIS